MTARKDGDLRERLIALANSPAAWHSRAHHKHEIALAAYRMAIEDAQRACKDQEARLPPPHDRTEFGQGCASGIERACTAVRALAEGM